MKLINKVRNIQSSLNLQIGIHELLRGYLDDQVGIPVTGARILDIGCGWLAPQTVLFQWDGARVTGIDIDATTFSMDWSDLKKIMRSRGLLQLVKKTGNFLVFDKIFFRALQNRCKRFEAANGYDIRRMDATHLSLEPDSFDFVFSIAVFEHIRNVSAAVEQVNRVLKPSGCAAISIHLFPSLSGGHATEAEQRGLPWGHLRGGICYGSQFLNRLTMSQLRDIFRENTNVVKEKIQVEGEEWLTPEIERELGKKGYSREDLLSRSITFFCSKSS